MRAVGLARTLFGIACAGLAVYMLAYGDFAPAGQSLPTWIAGRAIWITASAILVLAASAGLCIPRVALPGVWILAAYFVVWSALGVPGHPAHPVEWYGFAEGLSLLAGAWLIFAATRAKLPGPPGPLAGAHAARVARAVFGLTCVFYGWSHFAFADYTATMVPGWLPGRLAIAYITGFGHAAAGLALIIGILPRLGATLEAVMMSSFSLLVWAPSFFADPRPTWATPPQNQWSEFVVTVLLTAAAWVVAASLRNVPWFFASSRRA
jgi:uncharacterized membrane protein